MSVHSRARTRSRRGVSSGRQGTEDDAYLADFGLTKVSGEKGLTKTGQFVGTLDYISPEQIRGQDATAKSDIYALAAVLYECLTGVVPYAKDSEARPTPRPR